MTATQPLEIIHKTKETIRKNQGINLGVEKYIKFTKTQ